MNRSLISVFTSNQYSNSSGAVTYLPVTEPNGEDIQRRASSFSGMSLHASAGVSTTINAEPMNKRVQAGWYPATILMVLGVHPALERPSVEKRAKNLGAGPVVAWAMACGRESSGQIV
jgi:hypothetical protein